MTCMVITWTPSHMQTGAENLEMLVIGRVILGLGIGLSQQSMPLFLTESAPFNLRGSMFITNQLASVTGNFAAQMINYKMNELLGQPGGEWVEDISGACR